MAVVTESDLRAQLRRPTQGARVAVPAGHRLSPAAQDFVKQWSLEIVESGETGPGPRAQTPHRSPVAEWDTDAVFPVRLSGPIPTCTTCGSEVRSKPSAITQLNAGHFAPKTHPRIIFRGKVDSLLATVMMAENRAIAAGERELVLHLATLAAYCRELTAAEYNEREAAELRLRGECADDIHRVTHDPVGALGIEHLTIDGASTELQHWLNLCRTQTRELEVVAEQTFESAHHPYGVSICHATNRLSSAFYALQLRLEAGCW